MSEDPRDEASAGDDAPGEPSSDAPEPTRADAAPANAAAIKGALAVSLAFALLLSFSVGRCSAPAHEHDESATSADADTVWTCSMHPQVRADAPGACPLCGMDLIPLSDASGELPGDRVVLSERARALAALRVEPVRRLDAPDTEVRLLGRVEPDESTLRAVTTWVGGRIDRLHVRETGVRVGRGQAIATLYSPEVYAAQQDLITSTRQVSRLAGGSELARGAAEAALESARQRLRLLGVPDADLAGMERATRPSTSITIRSPYGGTVLERVATEGATVGAGAPLYRVADLRRVWAVLDAYEQDLPGLAVGQLVQIESESLPGERFEGRIGFVEPTLDPRRRTARVRVELDNDDGRLRPGIFVSARVAAASLEERGRPLVIPDTAALFTGRRSLVYVEVPGQDRPTYEAREVRLGPRAGEFFPVASGLREGERVVVRGAFVLDADLQIRGGDSMMTRPDDRTPLVESLALSRSPALRDYLAPIVGAYLDTGEALAADSLETAQAAAQRIREGAERDVPEVDGAAPLATMTPHLAEYARALSAASDIESARAAFEHLSMRVREIFRVYGNPTDESVRVAFCPMAFGSRGGEWLQRGEEVDNVYYGAAMQSCGEVQATIDPGAHLLTPSRAELDAP